MSTYYYFVCKACNKISDGMFVRNGAGWGNVDIIDCFQFIMKHSDLCGNENIRIMNEFEIDDDEKFGSLPYEYMPYDKDKKTLHCYYPHSKDFDKEEQDKRLNEYLSAEKVEL